MKLDTAVTGRTSIHVCFVSHFLLGNEVVEMSTDKTNLKRYGVTHLAGVTIGLCATRLHLDER